MQMTPHTHLCMLTRPDLTWTKLDDVAGTSLDIAQQWCNPLYPLWTLQYSPPYWFLRGGFTMLSSLRMRGEWWGLTNFMIIWDNVNFHCSILVRRRFAARHQMLMFLPSHSPFLNPIEEFYSAWRWKVCDHQLYNQLSLLDAMNCNCKLWLCHAKRFFPLCLESQDIRCDVEVLWPNKEERLDAQ